MSCYGLPLRVKVCTCFINGHTIIQGGLGDGDLGGRKIIKKYTLYICLLYTEKNCGNIIFMLDNAHAYIM